MSHLELLRNVSLFAPLSEDELSALASQFIVQSFRQGQVLFQQGSATNSLYIVKAGSVKVTSFGPARKITYSGVYGPEQYFGEFSLLDGLPRSGEAVALTNSTLLVLSRPAFFRFLEQQSTASIKLLVTVARRMRFAVTSVDQPVPLAPEQKIASLLAEIAEQYTGERQGDCARLSVRLSGDDLASLSGVTRDEACTALENLRRSGALTLEHTHVGGVDLARLREHLALRA